MNEWSETGTGAGEFAYAAFDSASPSLSASLSPSLPISIPRRFDLHPIPRSPPPTERPTTRRLTPSCRPITCSLSSLPSLYRPRRIAGSAKGCEDELRCPHSPTRSVRRSTRQILSFSRIESFPSLDIPLVFLLLPLHLDPPSLPLPFFDPSSDRACMAFAAFAFAFASPRSFPGPKVSHEVSFLRMEAQFTVPAASSPWPAAADCSPLASFASRSFSPAAAASLSLPLPPSRPFDSEMRIDSKEFPSIPQTLSRPLAPSFPSFLCSVFDR